MKYRHVVGFLFDLHLLLQGLFDLATPILLSVLAAWLLHAKAGVGEWIYAVLIPVGTFVGLFSMISYLIRILPKFHRDETQNGENQQKGEPKTPRE